MEVFMNYDLVVIGGSAAGLIAAKTAKLANPEKSVLIVRMEEISLVPCGIPYIFSTLNSIDENKMGIDPIKKLGVDFLIENVEKVLLHLLLLSKVSDKRVSL
jgi:NADH oxidase (H2O2-forming)